MIYLLVVLTAISLSAAAYCIIELQKIKENKDEELVKDKPKGIITDAKWKKEYFENITDHADVVYIEVIELEKIGNGFSKIGFVKISGNLHEQQKKLMKKSMPQVLESNKITWSKN